MRLSSVFLLLLVSGCAIADRSDKFGAEVEFSIGGIASYIIDIELKASIGFSKTCLENEHAISNDPYLYRWLEHVNDFMQSDNESRLRIGDSGSSRLHEEGGDGTSK